MSLPTADDLFRPTVVPDPDPDPDPDPEGRVAGEGPTGSALPSTRADDTPLNPPVDTPLDSRDDTPLGTQSGIQHATPSAPPLATQHDVHDARAPRGAHDPESPHSAPGRTTGAEQPARAPSGRVRHDEKMTVYITSDELLDVEHTRLLLRRDQGLAVDRGRLVRTALSLVLADYEAWGAESALVQRLTQE